MRRAKVVAASLLLFAAPLTGGGEARAQAEVEAQPAPRAEVRSDPEPMPRVHPRGPAPVPMPRVQPRGPRPVPMPQVQLPGDVTPMPELRSTPEHPRLRLR